jgi:hypothetical protein
MKCNQKSILQVITSRLAAGWLALTLASVAQAQYNPVPLTAGSFTQDIIVEKSAPPPLASFTTATIDQGTNDYGNTFFEQGYVSSLPWIGLPPHGTTFVSDLDPNHVFQMPPSYVTNNAAYVGAANIPGTSTLQVQASNAVLNVSDPTAYSAISILWASGSASAVQGLVNVTISHADGSLEYSTITTIDWFDTTATAAAYAWIAQGRVAVDGSGPLNTLRSTTQTKLFNTDISLSDTTSPVTNILFSYSPSGSTTNYRFFAFAVSGSTDNSHFAPVANLSGFNEDAVVESNAPVRAGYVPGTTVTMDQGINNAGQTFFEQGFGTNVGTQSPLNVGTSGLPGSGTSGLPHPGTVITSGTHSFKMPPTYTGNDCVFIGNYAAGAITNGSYSSPNYLTGSFTISSPAPCTALAILNSAGNGPVTINYTINYDDGSAQTGSFQSLDWFNTVANVFNAAGRVSVDGSALNNINGSPAGALFSADITLNNTTASATNIVFTYGSGGRAALFALSGQTTSGGNFSPLDVTGFDADIVVEAGLPLYNGGLFSATTATMDLGTNNANNTWFEKGWVTNGAAISSGLPPAGSTFASLQAANRIYQMPATYTGPNAVLIDTNHQVANITPTTPGTYSAFALLTAGASIGAANTMTNVCILQHADGTSETNVFFGYDWFNTTVLPAFIANGRADTRYGSGTSLFGNPQNPRLFETIFPVNNVTSPVTNILVQYKTGPKPWTTYVLAVSASSGAVQPVLGITSVNGSSSLTTFEGTNVVFSASTGGTEPITYQWQFSVDGTNWANVNDGGTISGATTPSLTNSSVVWSNTGQYRLTASNAAGSSTNGIGLLTVYSSLPDVTSPGDPITAFGGTTPAAETVDHAIDNVAQKYLNFGANGGTPPFVGPVGLIVSPQGGVNTIVSAMRFYTANDSPERDPADYVLEGSTDGGNTWATIASGPLALPAGRNGTGTMPVIVNTSLTNFFQEVHFANTTPYSTYRWTVNNVANNTTANSMQIGEIELLGVSTGTLPVITRQPVPTLNIFAGASPTVSLTAVGYPTNLTYQWYSNNVSVSGATNSSFQISNVQPANSGDTFKCVVSNVTGSVTSSVATLNVLAAPTTAYPQTVLADHPLAFWRLDEGPDDGAGNAGVVANDYWGGHAGVYTNVTLAQPGYSVNDPDTAALFGLLNGSPLTADSYAGEIAGIDFSTPTNQSANFSVEAWVNGLPQDYDAGIISKGSGGGGEQFTLDTGATAAGAHGIRFFVRDSSGTVHSANTGTNVIDYAWHHVVGVCDETHSNVTLYVDGLVSSVAAISPSNGLLSSSAPVSIGSRMAAATGNYNNQFYGTIDEAAVYNYALTIDQVRNHYFSAGIAPVLLIQPTNTTVADGGTAVFYSAASGSPTLQYQWFHSNGAQPTTLLPGMTSSNLTLTGVTSVDSGSYYQLVVTNTYGTVTSDPVQLTVFSGPPVVISDIPPQTFVYAGRSFVLPVTFGGTTPFTYQWQHDGGNLNDDARISGSHSNVLVVANSQAGDAGTYQLLASNAQGGPTPSGQGTVIVESVPAFNTDGLGWTPNTGATYAGVGFNNNVLTLTDGAGNENSAFWFATPLNINAFTATWTYQATAGDSAILADGMAFAIQNDTRGTSALGGAGGALGYGGITPSAALEFNIYPNNTIGIALRSNGATGVPYNSTSPVDFSDGDLIGVSVHYAGGMMTVTLNDTNQSTTYTTNMNAGSLATIVGSDTAYIGFTGGTGGSDANQAVSNFQFIPIPTLSAQTTGPNTLLVSWPASIGGYALQSNSDLTASGGWQPVNAPVNQVGGQNQVGITTSTGNTFYRLVLQ